MEQKSNELKYAEDEIDLRELWKTIVTYKKLIMVLTGAFVLLAVIFVLIKAPVYEIKSVIDIGIYNNMLLEEPTNLAKRLDVQYIMDKDDNATTYLDTASPVKGSKDLVELSVLSSSNALGVSYMEEIIQTVKHRHNVILQSYVSLIESKIKNLEVQKDDLLTEQKKLTDTLAKETAMMDAVLKTNPAVAAVYTIERNNKSKELAELRNNIFTLNSDLNDLFMTISSSALQETDLLTKIATDEKPIKPKKGLIVVVVMMTGLMVSVFLAFFLAFIGKNEHA